MTPLPPPACPLGYPRAQLEQVLDAQQLARLDLWMNGQTGAICEGRRYDPLMRDYYPDACAEHPHGMVVYRWDVERWLEAGPIVD